MANGWTIAGDILDSIVDTVASFFGGHELYQNIVNDISRGVDGKPLSEKTINSALNKIKDKYNISQSKLDSLSNRLLSLKSKMGLGSSSYNKAVDKLENKLQDEYNTYRNKSNDIEKAYNMAATLASKYENMDPTKKGLWGSDYETKINQINKEIN